MPTTSHAFFMRIFNTCVDLGVTRQKLLSLIPGGEKTLLDPASRIPVDTMLSVTQIAEQVLGMSDIGIRIGRNIQPTDLSDSGYAIAFSTDLGSGIRTNIRYQALIQQFGKSSLEVHGNEAWLSLSVDHDPEISRPITETIFASQVQFGRWLTWQFGDALHRMHFRHKEPTYSQKVEDFFDCKIHYQRDVDMLVFDKSVLNHPMPQANETLYKNTCRKLDVQMIALDTTHSLQQRITQLLEILLPDGTVDSTTIAGKLGISDRSLRRHLQAENLNFRQLLSDTRQALCKRYMQSGQHDLQAISHQLGYSEQSAFTRAFKTWYGLSPAQYARRNDWQLPGRSQ